MTDELRHVLLTKEELEKLVMQKTKEERKAEWLRVAMMYNDLKHTLEKGFTPGTARELISLPQELVVKLLAYLHDKKTELV